jgi:IS4 transposase
VFLTNNFDIPALTVAELYRNRWRIELFFKWIKQHLKIKSFFGTSPNAIGIGEGLSAFALPHHRTYGSVYGGSCHLR